MKHYLESLVHRPQLLFYYFVVRKYLDSRGTEKSGNSNNNYKSKHSMSEPDQTELFSLISYVVIDENVMENLVVWADIIGTIARILVSSSFIPN